MTDFARWDTASESSAAPPPFSIHRPATLPRRGMERRPFFSRIPTFTKWATAAWSIVTSARFSVNGRSQSSMVRSARIARMFIKALARDPCGVSAMFVDP